MHVKSIGPDGIDQCGSVRRVVPVAAMYSAGDVGWRIPALDYRGTITICAKTVMGEGAEGVGRVQL